MGTCTSKQDEEKEAEALDLVWVRAHRHGAFAGGYGKYSGDASVDAQIKS